MDSHHKYQIAIGQVLENDPTIQTTFFYDVRFTNNAEIKVHCQNCYCYDNCCCSTTDQIVDSNYNKELQQLTSEYQQCFLKVKLDQTFDTQAYKILNEDLTFSRPFESDSYQPLEQSTTPDYQPLIDVAPTNQKIHVYAPIAIYPNEEYYQSIQNHNQEFEQLCFEQYQQMSSPKEYQQSNQSTTSEEQCLATIEYQPHQDVNQHPVYYQFTPTYQQSHITQEPTPAQLIAKLCKNVQTNEYLDLTDTQDDEDDNSRLYLNKKRQRTIDVQEVSPIRKYAKLSIFHNVCTMSQSSN